MSLCSAHHALGPCLYIFISLISCRRTSSTAHIRNTYKTYKSCNSRALCPCGTGIRICHKQVHAACTICACWSQVPGEHGLQGTAFLSWFLHQSKLLLGLSCRMRLAAGERPGSAGSGETAILASVSIQSWDGTRAAIWRRRGPIYAHRERGWVAGWIRASPSKKKLVRLR